MKDEILEKIYNREKSLVLNEQKEGSSSFVEMISMLLCSQTQVHIFHLQTKSYAEHKALQGYYEGIDALVDALVESYQGKYGILETYKAHKLLDYTDSEQVVKYFENIDRNIEKNRKSVKESFVQNQIDGIQELIYSTTYKLKFLK
jgi:hypothetical protein